MTIKNFGGSIAVILVVLMLNYLHKPALARDNVLSLIEIALKKTPSFSGDFTQEYLDAFQNRKKNSKGKFYFRSPGLIKWIYQSPEELEITAGKEKIWVYDPALENVIVQRIKADGMNPLLFLFRYGKLNNYFKEIKPKFKLLDDKTGRGSVFLAPLKKDPDVSEIHIAFNKKTYRIKQFAIIDHSGGHRKITFLNLNYQTTADLSEFEFKPPEGTEIINNLGNIGGGSF